MTTSAVPPVLTMQGLVATFGPTRALDGASLTVAPGTIHGLIGHNGAGKSTLIKVLAGLVTPQGGTIALDGAPVTEMTPEGAETLGIAFIHQERLLVSTATVGEALFLGRESAGSRFGILRGSLQRRAEAALERFFGISLPKGALIRDLSTAQQQIVQITRALLAEPRILVFDEPTAALAQREVEHLFAAIRRLKARGLTTLYISHYLAEIEQLCDAVTVMRNGRDVAHVDPRQVPAGGLAQLMIGRPVTDLYPRQRAAPGAPVLALAGVGAGAALRDVSFTLRRGEVLGLTGLLGSGAKELVQALFGLAPITAGTVMVDGQAARLNSPTEAVRRGIALVPEDRRAHGVALDLGIRENLTLASLARLSRWGWLDREAERRRAQDLIGALQVEAGGRDAPVRTLSGGNQQKVVLGKWLAREARLYILDEPTVGVDIAAKAEIYRLIADAAERGAGILLLSADLDELLGLCDRILVLFRGTIVAEHTAAGTDAGTLLQAALTGGVTGVARAA
ncbi:sugar ABC transporter ATP-binding protein (plasmid) [Methylobacterium sp. NMS14P]|uniref:sugar ABC transporter ATP-binding protein n=1 Tax=Methylobacterium sp. NMS14P TaxID=2894310 RepID=UPI0023588CA0|nr:sugar ABC transporter ATP-binding protein [Methylobacterium sp. NMS14P]WCS28626.1 sugar ABC transporter ATP-binding protein [Methylobacterium sp. NMS14P]